MELGSMNEGYRHQGRGFDQGAVEKTGELDGSNFSLVVGAGSNVFW